MNHCPKCSLDLPATARFCERCGEDLLDDETTLVLNILKCPSCGNEGKAGAEVCANCNYKFSWVAPTAASVARTCSKCGMANPLDSVFCLECGKLLDAAQASKQAGVEKPVATQLGPEPYTQPVIKRVVINVEKTLACNNCGTWNQVGMRFCEACGKPVGVQSSPAIKPKKSRRPILIAIGSFALLAGLLLFWYLWGVQVTVHSNPPGARVFLDGEEIGQTSFSDGQVTAAHLGRGQHTLRVERLGFETLRHTFDLGALDFSKTIEAQLAPSVFTLTIVTEPPGCRVSLDSNDNGMTDSYRGEIVLTGVSRGQHSLTLRREGYQNWTRDITLESSQLVRANLTPIEAPPEDEPQYSNPAEREIESTLQGWAQTLSNKDLDGNVRYYADRVDPFLSLGNKSRDEIRANRMKFFSMHSTVNIQLSNIHINVEPGGTRAVVTLDTKYYFVDNKPLTGAAQNEFWLEKRGSAWLITKEKHIQTYYETTGN